MGLATDEVLGGVVEGLLRALRSVRPRTVRQFFALANQHMRWELNDLARRLDEQPRVVELIDAPAASTAGTTVGPGPNMRRMLEAIDTLPEAEREVFSLVRIQGLTHGEAADILDVSPKTVQRRVHRSLLLLSERLGDLRPESPPAVGAGDGASAP